MRRTYRYKGLITALSVIGMAAIVITDGGRRNGRLSTNVWQKPFITKHALNRGLGNSLSQMSSKTV